MISVPQGLVALRKAVREGICVLAGRLREAFETLAAGTEHSLRLLRTAPCPVPPLME